ncbi:MAG: hypothetical protein CMM94_02690 [Rickettsiales bacterium]|nr:hypothetical protein [Rickettsiales bacterium]
MTTSDERITLTEPYGDGEGYTEGYLIFIDILGFSEFVKSQDFTTVNELLNGFEGLKSDGEVSIATNQENYKKMLAGEKWTGAKGFRDAFTIVSDTLLCFFPDAATFEVPKGFVSDKYAEQMSQFSLLSRILHEVTEFQFYLLNYGLLSRGAVTHGEMYHKNGNWFGPAMIDAHRIEKNNPYPRVTLSQNLADKFNALEKPKGQSLIVLKDDDNTMYFDYLSWLHTRGFAEGYEQGIERAMKMADEALAQFSNNSRVAIKWGWLKRKLLAKQASLESNQ